MFVASLASIGLGIAGAVSQSKAVSANAQAERLDFANRREAAELEFEKLDINIAQLTREFGEVTGSIGSALAGAGAEVTSGVSAQARAVTLAALARDVEVLKLNTDIATTALGFGPESEFGKDVRFNLPAPTAARKAAGKELLAFIRSSGTFDFTRPGPTAKLSPEERLKRLKSSAEASVAPRGQG